jgi:predicted nuclease of restriction endonuclease-like RecB superfamily
MQANNNIVIPKAGDLVKVFDDISSRDEWYMAADVVEKDSRIRVRLVGFNFYMSASLIKEVRHA